MSIDLLCVFTWSLVSSLFQNREDFYITNIWLTWSVCFSFKDSFSISPWKIHHSNRRHWTEKNVLFCWNLIHLTHSVGRSISKLAYHNSEKFHDRFQPIQESYLEGYLEIDFIYIEFLFGGCCFDFIEMLRARPDVHSFMDLMRLVKELVLERWAVLHAWSCFKEVSIFLRKCTTVWYFCVFCYFRKMNHLSSFSGATNQFWVN